MGGEPPIAVTVMLAAIAGFYLVFAQPLYRMIVRIHERQPFWKRLFPFYRVPSVRSLRWLGAIFAILALVSAVIRLVSDTRG
jgi:hypothetical protein